MIRLHASPFLNPLFGVVVLFVAAVGALSAYPLWTHAGSPAGAQEDKPATSGDKLIQPCQCIYTLANAICHFFKGPN